MTPARGGICDCDSLSLPESSVTRVGIGFGVASLVIVLTVARRCWLADDNLTSWRESFFSLREFGVAISRIRLLAFGLRRGLIDAGALIGGGLAISIILSLAFGLRSFRDGATAGSLLASASRANVRLRRILPLLDDFAKVSIGGVLLLSFADAPRSIG